MGDLKIKVDGLVSRINQIWKTLSEQKESFEGLVNELKAIAEAAEKIDAENEKLAEENRKLVEVNKKLQEELAGMKKID